MLRTPRIALPFLCLALVPLACIPGPKPPVDTACVFDFTMTGHGNQARVDRVGHGDGRDFELDTTACQAGGRIQINLSHQAKGARLYGPASNSCVDQRGGDGGSKIWFTLKLAGCGDVRDWAPEPSSPGVVLTIKPRP